MNIIGLDKLVFGVENIAAAQQFVLDYGLKQIDEYNFVAADGTGLEIRAKDDALLPPPLETGATIRKTVYGLSLIHI